MHIMREMLSKVIANNFEIRIPRPDPTPIFSEVLAIEPSLYFLIISLRISLNFRSSYSLKLVVDCKDFPVHFLEMAKNQLLFQA